MGKYGFFKKQTVVGLSVAFAVAASLAIYAALAYGLNESDALTPQMSL